MRDAFLATGPQWGKLKPAHISLAGFGNEWLAGFFFFSIDGEEEEGGGGGGGEEKRQSFHAFVCAYVHV
jgi:hypothetical protein